MFGLYDFVSASVLAVAFCAAASSPPSGRREAMICAASLIPIFLNYEATWIPEANLALIAQAHGVPIRKWDVWTTFDLAGGLIALTVAWRFLWGVALYSTFVAETVAHWLRWRAHLIDQAHYYALLDICFFMQGALFLAIGGRGLFENVGRFALGLIRRWRVVLVLRFLSPPEAIDHRV